MLPPLLLFCDSSIGEQSVCQRQTKKVFKRMALEKQIRCCFRFPVIRNQFFKSSTISTPYPEVLMIALARFAISPGRKIFSTISNGSAQP